jgi:hypothetical protein
MWAVLIFSGWMVAMWATTSSVVPIVLWFAGLVVVAVLRLMTTVKRDAHPVSDAAWVSWRAPAPAQDTASPSRVDRTAEAVTAVPVLAIEKASDATSA